jgi:uncharacterized protein (DUF3084 family)
MLKEKKRLKDESIELKQELAKKLKDKKRLEDKSVKLKTRACWEIIVIFNASNL